MEESILNHSIAISRIEDCEDNMQVCKGDIDVLRSSRRRWVSSCSPVNINVQVPSWAGNG
jgi:hypothetical protein